MGGKTPRAPVQSNAGEFAMAEALTRQNDLLYQQSLTASREQEEADIASADRMREINIRDAEAKAEQDEREVRAKKGKKDLLYRNAMGVQGEDESDLFKLGGA